MQAHLKKRLNSLQALYAELIATKTRHLGLLKTRVETRYSLYKKFSSDTNKLPPTKGAFHQHVLRSFGQIAPWSTAHSLILDLQNINDNGWEDVNGVLMPVSTRDLIAPRSR